MEKDKFIVKKNTKESTSFAIRIDKDIADRLDEAAAKTNRSRNSIINDALRFAMDKMELQE